jgi:hypothetical protein
MGKIRYPNRPVAVFGPLYTVGTDLSSESLKNKMFCLFVRAYQVSSMIGTQQVNNK